MNIIYIKRILNLLVISFTFFVQPCHAWFYSVNSSLSTTAVSPVNDKAHNEWLKNKFSKQHQELIPIVAVADMFLICNQTRKMDNLDYEISFLINEMHKNTLAEKLSQCLGEDTMQSDVALNFGLYGCFHAQLAHLTKVDREQKMKLVKQAISSLSHEERKKSFTQCVTEQSIHYLK